MGRADDLTPLLMMAATGSSGDIGFRQGTVTAWDPATGNNTINVGGSDLTNLPVLAGSTTTIAVGDVVGLLSTKNQFFVLGSIQFQSLRTRVAVYPGTPEAITADGTWRDAAVPGPSVTAYIGNSRQCLVFMAMMYNATASLPGCNVAVSGASTIAPDNINAAAAGYSGGSTTLTMIGAMSTFRVLTADDGLNQGSNTFTLKYKATNDTGGSHLFWNRKIAVIPF